MKRIAVMYNIPLIRPKVSLTHKLPNCRMTFGECSGIAGADIQMVVIRPWEAIYGGVKQRLDLRGHSFK